MKNETRRILVVDDEPSMREFLSILLRRQEFQVETCETGDAAISLMKKSHDFHLVLTDLNMPGDASGIEVLKISKALNPACQVLVITAFASAETAVSAIKEGAYDYLTKPFKLQEARLVIARALEKFDLVRENHYLKSALKPSSTIIGKSEVIQQVLHLVSRVARTNTTILITGESGTGKELVAKEIHTQSSVNEGPFIPVNCGAIPESLIDAELFGYKKGAFTGADKDRLGVVDSAEGGTLFLDEIGELPLSAQVRLLRFLQEKKIKAVGDMAEHEVSCRVVAATNRDLKTEVQEGRFREDLFYRLNIIPIQVPPLRERSGDIRLLIEHFVAKYSERIGVELEGISGEAMAALVSYTYPGNVRELENIIERAVTLELGTILSTASLPADVVSISEGSQTLLTVTEDGINVEEVLEGIEKDFIHQAMHLADGNKTDAARLLGLSFRSFRYRWKKLQLDEDP